MDDNVILKSDITTHEEFKRLKPETATDRKLVSEKALFEQLKCDIL